MTLLHGPRRFAASLGLVAVCAGCGDDLSTTAAPHTAPSRAADCADLPALGGDPGIVLGTDWSGEHHAFGDTVVVYGCVSPSLGGRVSLVANGPGVQVHPAVVSVDRSGSGIIAFRVTVLQHASSGVRIQLKGGGVGADLPGPVVATAGDGWHFVPHTG